jgi:thymidylate synthase (FAD)
VVAWDICWTIFAVEQYLPQKPFGQKLVRSPQKMETQKIESSVQTPDLNVVQFAESLSVEYIQHTGSDLTVVNAARVSLNQSSQSLQDKDIKLIKYLADNEHMSPFEHCTVTVLIECPLYVRSQIMRHRTFSYNEISRRYTSDDIKCYVPSEDDVRLQGKTNRQASGGNLDQEQAHDAVQKIRHIQDLCVVMYFDLLKMGVCREQARGVLPQNLMTRFYMTGNLRNYAHFLGLRLKHDTQKETRVLAEKLLAILERAYPHSLKALGVECKGG